MSKGVGTFLPKLKCLVLADQVHHGPCVVVPKDEGRRVWKTPWDSDSAPFWLGGGTGIHKGLTNNR
jgi:hypothetical protein